MERSCSSLSVLVRWTDDLFFCWCASEPYVLLGVFLSTAASDRWEQAGRLLDLVMDALTTPRRGVP
ncbi:hypothetical protein [Nonomuraea sp. B1E8]|uniref:hypothetical protein n=1 Tax=unclassified Nonomuraea TaxID=2593643 RepID=UPI00325C8919